MVASENVISSCKRNGKNSPSGGGERRTSEETFHSDSIRTRRSPLGLKYPFDTSWRLHNTRLEPNNDVPAACRDQRPSDWSKGEVGGATAGRAGVHRSRRNSFVSRQKSPGWLSNKAPSACRPTPAGSQGPKSRERKITTTTTTNKQMRNGGQVNGCQQRQRRWCRGKTQLLLTDLKFLEFHPSNTRSILHSGSRGSAGGSPSCHRTKTG